MVNMPYNTSDVTRIRVVELLALQSWADINGGHEKKTTFIVLNKLNKPVTL